MATTEIHSQKIAGLLGAYARVIASESRRRSFRRPCTLSSSGITLLMRLAVEIIGVHGSLLDEFLGSDCMKGEHSPSLLVHDESVPSRSGDRHPPSLGRCARRADQPVR